MEFTKMHGLGNDFIIVDNMEEALQERVLAELAVQLCRRGFGVGADGLAILGSSRKASFRMRIFNPDGSEAEMCGNAIRCLARYARERCLTDEDTFFFETGAGLKQVWLSMEGTSVRLVKVDMGEPILDRDKVPINVPSLRAVNEKIEAGGEELVFTAVSMGNPHCVIFVSSLDTYPWQELGRELEGNPLFPNRTNVEFVEAISRGEVKVKVWERGVGPTLACGTGACAAAVAGVLTGRMDRDAAVHLPGGTLNISWAEDGKVYMEGPAEEVYEGRVNV